MSKEALLDLQVHHLKEKLRSGNDLILFDCHIHGQQIIPKMGYTTRSCPHCDKILLDQLLAKSLPTP